MTLDVADQGMIGLVVEGYYSASGYLDLVGGKCSIVGVGVCRDSLVVRVVSLSPLTPTPNLAKAPGCYTKYPTDD